MEEPRTLRCPLCAQAFSVRSEQECEAHIANCTAFNKEFGQGSQRGGLVSGFAEAAAATAATAPQPPPAAAESALESACDKFAALLLPMVPIVFVENESRSAGEAIDMVAQLAGAILSVPPEDEEHADFGLEEVLAVTLGPYLPKLAGGQAQSLRTALPAAVAAVQQCPLTDESPTDLLTRGLQRRATRGGHELLMRFCATCGKSGGDHKLVACARCRAVRYCGESCQRLGWAGHKLLCKPSKEADGAAGR